MRIIKPSYEILNISPANPLELIELAGRVCYKSEDKITTGTADPFVRRILDSQHESVIEHASMTVKFTCDRGVSHEIVRHRVASFSQSSTRYCNYSKGKYGGEITVVEPYFWSDFTCVNNNVENYTDWKDACEYAERAYMRMLKRGASPQEARSVLPNSLMTEVVMTANMREWRHMLQLRTSKKAHPQMREIMVPLLVDLQQRIPALFESIGGEKEEKKGKFFLLQRECGFDEVKEFVIRAETAQEARRIAANHCASEGRDAWLLVANVIELTNSLEQGALIVRNYNAG